MSKREEIARCLAVAEKNYEFEATGRIPERYYALADALMRAGLA